MRTLKTHSSRSIGRLIALGVVLGAALVACSSPLGEQDTDSGSGQLSIVIRDSVKSRTLVPSIDLGVASYTVIGEGPDDASFTETCDAEGMVKGGLAFGSWTITVKAYNGDGIVLGSGSENVQVSTGETSAVSVSVTNLSGTGSLSLSVTWPEAQVSVPSIAATLTPLGGTAQTLSFSISAGTGTYESSSLQSGYYTLTFTLQDDTAAVAGASETVFIMAGQETSGNYSFENVNTP